MPRLNRLGTAAVLFLGGALVLSLYLAATSLAGTSIAGCSADGGGCHTVLSSRYGSVLGLPVSLAGAPIYGALILLAFRRGSRSRILSQSLSLMVIGAALWFGAVQLFVLHAFCPWCCTTHVFAVAGTAALTWSRRTTTPVSPHHLALPAGVAFAALLAMAALQAIGPAPDHTQQASLGSTDAAKRDGRFVTMHGGRFVLDPAILPTIGSPGAESVAIALGDYTCGYCRKLHTQLQQLVAAYPVGKLCIIELPVARDEKAAEIQRLMLSLWRTHPRAKAQLEKRIHQRTLPVELPAIRRAAEELLGTDEVRTALIDHAAWADAQIALASEILRANREATGVPHLPQLVAGEEVNIGASRDLHVYLDLFERNLALRAPDEAALARAAPQATPDPTRSPGAPPQDVFWPTRSSTLATASKPGRAIKAPRKGISPDEIPLGYFSWILDHFALPDEIAQAAPHENPDLDSTRNGAEYWCRLHPRQHDHCRATVRRDAQGKLIYSLELRDDDTSPDGFFHFSDELRFAGLTDRTAPFASLSPSDPVPGDGLVTWFADDPVAEPALSRFVRAEFKIFWPADRACVDLCAAAAVQTCQSEAGSLHQFFHACLRSCEDGNCLTITEQVCGCDQQSYRNTCEAAAAQAGIEHMGNCLTNPCASNNDCSAADYCLFENGCTGPGTCSPKPVACPEVWAPVCGCDGQTYGNACKAAAAGVNVASEGECAAKCTSNTDCGEADYCLFDDGCNGPGTCIARPIVCPRIYDPVCGCDDKTYGNACEAASAGMNVAYRGVCIPKCTSNADCDGADYCLFDDGCNGPGTCVARPRVCLLVFDPVCGCDGRTYGNACEAAGAGVNVAFEGACEQIP